MNTAPTSLQTSFAGMVGQDISGLKIESIEIPLIQRDYAQGRAGETINRIRDDLIAALCGALRPDGVPLDLDFVYGDVGEDGIRKGLFYPLDGQQRLTTLFLLHCYLAWHVEVSPGDQPWARFSYATRPGARLFCQRLTNEFRPSPAELGDDSKLSDWLLDQPDYLPTWRYDPTIQSMLVMLDTLHLWFRRHPDVDVMTSWQRLTDPDHPAITFHLLPMAANGLTDDLYIKMNSRGRPLTHFENFKAHFHSLLHGAHPGRADAFAHQVDTGWADILWPYRGDDNLIDDEFMRYFRFVSDLCVWRSGAATDARVPADLLAEQVYGRDNPKSADHLEFLFQAFEVWKQQPGEQVENYIRTEFEFLLTATPGGASPPLVLFNAFPRAAGVDSPVDLFAACCRWYGEKTWTLAHSLLLYAVLLHRTRGQRENTAPFPLQLRVLRNLIEASSGNEIRAESMPRLLAEVERIIVDGTLQGITAFNQAQLANENDKAALLAAAPGLRTAVNRLEDHRLLRGGLAAFDLGVGVDPARFQQRADGFHVLFDNPGCWRDLIGALLAIGDYARPERERWTGYHFADSGSPDKSEPWRQLFQGKLNERPHPATKVLMSLLDQVAAAKYDIACLRRIQDDFVQQCAMNGELNWRYYFVKYPVMRGGASGRYVMGPKGYMACMLEKTVMRSYYRDPYLLAIVEASGVDTERLAEPWPWFYGYENQPRELILRDSAIRLQCVETGWQITRRPTDPASQAVFEQICGRHGIGPDLLYAVSQNTAGIDERDRVELGERLLTDLADGGF